MLYLILPFTLTMQILAPLKLVTDGPTAVYIHTSDDPSKHVHATSPAIPPPLPQNDGRPHLIGISICHATKDYAGEIHVFRHWNTHYHPHDRR
jgi:hypothetical protein